MNEPVYVNSLDVEHRPGDVIRNAAAADPRAWVYVKDGRFNDGGDSLVDRSELPAELRIIVRNGKMVVYVNSDATSFKIGDVVRSADADDLRVWLCESAAASAFRCVTDDAAAPLDWVCRKDLPSRLRLVSRVDDLPSEATP